MKILTIVFFAALLSGCGVTPYKFNQDTNMFPERAGANITTRKIKDFSNKEFSVVNLDISQDAILADFIRRQYTELFIDAFKQLGFKEICLNDHECSNGMDGLNVKIKYFSPMRGNQYERRMEVYVLDSNSEVVFWVVGEKLAIFSSHEKELIYPTINKLVEWMNYNDIRSSRM
ncbi:hypothetical protein [Aliidiomarina indica]|uniref:hypothetical protein n=1 Tax=Aliidiomarina indica TaxID=2749147 RepID=UPI00188F4E50|nr:hypothetical protein [Aliidiomarina indica]